MFTTRLIWEIDTPGEMHLREEAAPNMNMTLIMQRRAHVKRIVGACQPRRHAEKIPSARGSMTQ
eukprot:3425287-Karenia_brevis.AAC.1